MSNYLAPVGTHCILEIYGCPFTLLNSEEHIRETLTQASKQGMSTLLNLTSHKFDPQGVTALALLAESHISIHTWPETGYAALDVFTCGDHARPEQACEFLVQTMQASRYSLKVLPRGGASNQPIHAAKPTPRSMMETVLCPVPN